MINPLTLKECIKPETPESIKRWICFTNHHHNEYRNHEETVKKFKKSEIGQYINFEKLEEEMKPKPIKPTVVNLPPPTKVILKLDHQQAAELFRLLEDHKEDHLELHELTYQAMSHELFNRI